MGNGWKWAQNGKSPQSSRFKDLWARSQSQGSGWNTVPKVRVWRLLGTIRICIIRSLLWKSFFTSVCKVLQTKLLEHIRYDNFLTSVSGECVSLKRFACGFKSSTNESGWNDVWKSTCKGCCVNALIEMVSGRQGWKTAGGNGQILNHFFTRLWIV